MFRHDFAISKCAQGGSTRKVSLRDLKMCTAPQRERFDPSKCCACHEICTQAGKYCACHEICTKSSKVLRVPRNLHEQLESSAPVTKNDVIVTCKTLKMLRLPRYLNFTLSHRTRKTARDCRARMISTDFSQICSRESEPIARSRKRLRAHSKQNTSKRQPLKRESQWICNANVNLHKTLRLRSKTTSDMPTATIPAQGHEK